MKKLTLLPLLLILSAFISNPETVVKHHGYTSFYNPSLQGPDSVCWSLEPASVNCSVHLARTNDFIADPAVPNTNFAIFYAGSGYDQGHQYPAQDASCDNTNETECFYYTNMLPQRPNLNRITWKALEVYTRLKASTQLVQVTCGQTGSLGTLVGVEKRGGKIIKHPSNINIPAYCWKVLRFRDSVQYYVMPNQDTVKNHPFSYYRVSH